MKKLFMIGLIGIFIILSLSFISAVTITKENNGNSGSIWTTREDCVAPQNENQYNIGEHVWINGTGFDSLTEYEWRIVGLPENNLNGGASCDAGTTVKSGSETTNANGEICFDAYTVQEGDCGEYKAYFDNKKDNYHVVPEFGFVVGIMTILASVGVFLFVRRE